MLWPIRAPLLWVGIVLGHEFEQRLCEAAFPGIRERGWPEPDVGAVVGYQDLLLTLEGRRGRNLDDDRLVNPGGTGEAVTLGHLLLRQVADGCVRRVGAAPSRG